MHRPGARPPLLDANPALNLSLKAAEPDRSASSPRPQPAPSIAIHDPVWVHVHLHEPGPRSAFSASLIIERTRVTGLGGGVVISNPDFLGGVPAGQASALIEPMVDAGVAVTTNVPSGDPKPPLRAGLVVGSGCDGELDSWAPFNRTDMLLKAYEMAQRYGLGADDDLQIALDVITTGGAAVMGVTGHGVNVGAAADLVLLPGEVAVEPVVGLPAGRTVIKAGRIVAPRRTDEAG